MIYKRSEGGSYFYRFRFAGKMIQKSSKSQSITIARDAERAHRRRLELAANGLKEKPPLPLTFKNKSEKWTANRTHTMGAKTQEIADNSLKHLLPVFGDKLLSEIEPQHIVEYQQSRLGKGKSRRTVNIELGTLRGVMGKRCWAALCDEDEDTKVKMLGEDETPGRALSKDEEAALLREVSKPHYRELSLYTIVVVALNTGMRPKEIRTLKWSQVDLLGRSLKVGKTKTKSGSYRVIQLNGSAVTVLAQWSSRTPEADPKHYIFPTRESGKVDSTKPVKGFRTAWRSASAAAGLQGLRFYDLRHTAVTNLLENGAPFAVVAEILGWSASATVTMAKRYGHIRPEAQRKFLDTIATQFPVCQNVLQIAPENPVKPEPVC